LKRIVSPPLLSYPLPYRPATSEGPPKGGALALLAKTYLFHTTLANHYSLAAQTAQQVEALGYSLTPKYYDNFSSDTKINTEEIFSVNHIFSTLGTGNELNAWFAPASSTDTGFSIPPKAWSPTSKRPPAVNPIPASIIA